MRNNYVIYVDFDSTLYDTEAFANNLWALIANKIGLPVDQVRKDSTSHFFHAYLGGYEYEKHIASYGLDSVEMWEALDTITNRTEYLYPDSTNFIQSLLSEGYEPKILTFGEKRFQLAKIRPMQQYIIGNMLLYDMEVIVVDRKKHEHIGALHAGQKGVLIDDKPHQTLPNGFTEIHLNRSEPLNEPRINGEIAIVSNLSQAREVIESLSSHSLS